MEAVALTPELLTAAMGCTPPRAQIWADPLAEACTLRSINTAARLAAFFAHIGHESGSLQFVRELWGPTVQQLRYERDPSAPWPADAVQARQPAFARNRLAYFLGNTEPGDGKRYSGRGPIQNTGRGNARRLTQRLRARLGPQVPDFELEPERLEEPRWGAHAAADYWDDRELNQLADFGTAAAFVQMTRAINGGLTGLEDRQIRWEKAKAVLASQPAYRGHVPPLPMRPPAPPAQPAPPAPPAPTESDWQSGRASDLPADATPKEPPTMAPLILGALNFGSTLVGALAQNLAASFAPLAQEKLTKELGRHTSSPQVAEQVATAMIETVKAATGKADPIEAVAAAKASPAVMQQAQDSALDTLDRLAPLLDKIAQWDESAWAAEEASRAAARQHNDGEQLLVNLSWLKLKFIHALSLAFISYSGWFVTTNWKDLTPELRGAVITLMIIAGWNGVRDYWMGSSRSSSAKDAVIGELSRRK